MEGGSLTSGSVPSIEGRSTSGGGPSVLYRKVGALVAVAAVALAACGGGASASPAASAGASAAAATDCVVGVSWNNFQQPRWAAHDQPGIKNTVEAAGGTYIDADANLSNEQQLTDVDTLISKGAKVLILLAQDNKAILPAVQKAKDAGIPVIAYDRLIEDPSALYITFDNVAVGKAEAAAILAKVPSGNYVLIKGDPGDPNASTFLPQGWDEAGLKAAVDSGKITILNGPDGTFTDAWKTEKAQSNMEAIIDKAVADGNEDRCHPRRERQHGARRRGCPHGQELRLPAPQRPGRRSRQPEQRRPGQAVRRRLEERERARQDRRRGRARAVQGHGHGQPEAARRPDRSDRRPGGRPDGHAVHHAQRHRRSARSSCSRPRSPRRTCSWRSTAVRSPRRPSARVSTPRRRRPPASSGHSTAELAIHLRPRDLPGGAGRSSPGPGGPS